MKNKILALALYVVASHTVFADTVTRVELGNMVLRVSQPMNEVFARQSVTLPALCHGQCDGVTVKWEALAPRLTTVNTPPGVYLFDSGVKGIAIRIDAPQQNGVTPADKALSLQIGLVKTSRDVAAGVMNLSTPLLQWSLSGQNGENALQADDRGQIVVGGALTVGSCEPTTGTLTFAPSPVRLSDLKRTGPGQPVAGSGDSQAISVTCTPGIASSLSATFLAKTLEGSPSVIQSDNPGVGFLMVDDVYHQTVWWDGSHPLVYPIPPNGQTRIPLSVFYTPTGREIRAGKVTAQAQFTIDYR
ncbi:fimbrial protein [Salmonella enterica]|nr:fimbrial protein [Salmonella enterica]ECC4608442.1 fimbrial protein [Salmonella enterica]ECJ1396105.1 fimbrial protein [Salmonella enterica]ECR4999308.1 fimbrial protein [Salmonella enterica]ECY1592218.1 fimbrial protein [Salmonella enterica]